jgi:hypothetical protein
LMPCVDLVNSSRTKGLGGYATRTFRSFPAILLGNCRIVRSASIAALGTLFAKPNHIQFPSSQR